MAVSPGSWQGRYGFALVELFRRTEQLQSSIKGLSPAELSRLEHPVAEGAEGETGQRIRLHPDRDEDSAILLDPAIGALDLALQPHRGQRLLRVGAGAQK